ncbi:MAG: flagellar biosynthesis anti-sigma factor FlgM [Burkholderiales bacterium]|nr:flagellar biosynthesis anti-sigma factor FlgM [Burkholderiales bacterium]
MKIGHIDNKPAVTPAVTERKSGTAAGNAGNGAEPSANVQLSAGAALLGTDSADAVFDADKVKRISDAIRDGKFTVNPEAIADKLIANAQELLQAKTKG